MWVLDIWLGTLTCRQSAKGGGLAGVPALGACYQAYQGVGIGRGASALSVSSSIAAR